MIHKSAFMALRNEKQLCIWLLLCSLLVAVFLIGQAYGIAYMVYEVFLNKQPLPALAVPLVFTAAMICLRVGFSYVQEALAQRLAHVTKNKIRQQVVTHMLALGAMSQERHGEVVHLLTDGLDNVESYIARYVPQMAYAIGIPFLMALAMMGAIPWVGILLFITYPLIPFFMILIGKKAGKMNEAQWERMSVLSGHFLDVLQGIATLKIFNRSEEQGAVIARLAAEFRDSTLRVLRVAFLSAFVLELVSTIATAIIAVYTGVALLYGEIDFFPAFFVLLLAPEFYSPLRQLGSAFHTGMAGEVALKKAEIFLSLPIAEPANGTKAWQGPLGDIEFRDVTFTYDGRPQPAVSDISFTVRPGERVMLVGESGAGKSTLAHLLLRMLTPTAGQIRVNGEDLLALESESWRQEIAFVPQKPYLFRGTIAHNIAFGRTATREEIIEAAKQAEAYDFIMAHPEGFDRVLGEGGHGLSGGEAQRIALARAFLGQSSLLLLDEVSAHLDVETEQALARGLARLMEGKTVVMIGHRIETMQWADTLLVMREGKIVQRGSLAALRQEPGYFRDLLTMGGVSVG